VRRFLAGALLFASSLSALSARAQEPTPTPAPTPLPLHPSVEIRERYDNPELPLGHNAIANVDPLHAALAFFWSRIRLGVLADPLPRFQAFAQIQDARYWGQEGGTLRSIKGVDLHQGWLHLGDREKFARLGRQEYALGEERLFGRDDWYEEGRVFDMIRLRSPLDGGKWIGEFLYAEVTNPVPDNTDQAFEVLNVTRLLGGADSFARVTAVEKHDSHRGPKTGNKLYIATLGAEAHLVNGPWVVDVEAAGQAGENYDDNQRAAFVAGSVRRDLGGPWSTRVGFEFSRGSGDGDDDDGNSRNIDVLYPTRHDKYGFLDLLSLQNQRHVALTLDSGGPRAGDTFHAAFRLLGLDNSKGRWINARGETIGRDPTGSHGRLLGWELDLALSRRVFPRLGDLVVNVEAGYFHGATLAKEIDHVVQAYEWVITLRYRFGDVSP
jgi:hypothetical protein